jgi:prevent-host-death family protein
MEVGIRQAKANLSKLVKSALAGERIVITSHGKPLVELAPAKPERKQRARGYGAFKGVFRLPAGWDSPAAEEEFLNQFDFYREQKGKKSSK